jgi:membrane-associated protease RseP (regulator of RpoE activity)
LELANFHRGLPYSALLISVLGAHELGHYIAARHYRVIASLPYFLPFPSFVAGVFPFGTLGAVIRLRSRIPNRHALFDIGIAGPLAGFVVSLAVLLYGFASLPSKDYLYSIHPEYVGLESIPQKGLVFGAPVLFQTLARTVPGGNAFVPPMNEVYHYPFICVGWFGLLVTSLNLIPVGQLDGGHITFAILGPRGKIISRVAFVSMLLFGLLGLLPYFSFPDYGGWPGWILWAGVLWLVFRKHQPQDFPTTDVQSIGRGRMALAMTAMLILFLSVALTPISFVE